MIPSKHARSLYFTPRTPWGRLPQNRPGQSQNYLRASQDKPLDPSSKTMQGFAGQIAGNQFSEVPGAPTRPWGTGQGAPPRALSSQTTPERADEISYASQQFPQTQRMPRTRSEIEEDLKSMPAPKQTSSAAAAPRILGTTLATQKPGPMPGRSEAQNAIQTPEWKMPDNPLQLRLPNGVILSPYLENGGGGVNGHLKLR